MIIKIAGYPYMILFNFTGTSMNQHRYLFLVLIWGCLLVSTRVLAGQDPGDSLLLGIQRSGISVSDQAREIVKLGRDYVISDPDRGMDYGQRALLLARQSKDPAALGYVYYYLSTIYFNALGSDSAAGSAMDSAMWYADKTPDPIVKGLAWYGKGWLQNIEGKPDLAVQSWQKALDHFEGHPEADRYRAGIYYLYFGIYSERGDLAQEQKFARLTLEAARRSAGEDIIAAAWQISGTSYLEHFETYQDSVMLDSALFAFKNSASLLQATGKPTNSIPATLSALYVAQVYMDHFPPWAKDSTLKYVHLALNNLKDTTTNKKMLVNCYTILSKYALQEGNVKEAENYLLRAQSFFAALDPPDFYLAELLYEQLADMAERKGNSSEALKYYKEYLRYYKKEFDARQFETVRRLEVRYQAEKKEKTILLLQGKEAFQRRQNVLYLGIAIAAVLGLVFLFLAYHFRLRYARQREKALHQEKEEARLQALLKEKEANRLALENQEAELRSRLHQEETARLEAEAQLLKARQEQLQRGLMAGALQVEHKNELLQELKAQLLTASDSEAAQLKRIFREESMVDEDFDKVRSEFKDLHPEFFNKLQKAAQGKLTALDLKYCAYVSMQLPTKQIASLLHVEAKSVRMAKYRLKQKLGLGKDDSLEAYLMDI